MNGEGSSLWDVIEVRRSLVTSRNFDGLGIPRVVAEVGRLVGRISEWLWVARHDTIMNRPAVRGYIMLLAL